MKHVRHCPYKVRHCITESTVCGLIGEFADCPKSFNAKVNSKPAPKPKKRENRSDDYREVINFMLKGIRLVLNEIESRENALT